ncbi:phage portal protein [Ferrimonas balearica]|uniref:phage portal protein n=1 Tax=Ferrimonas balearica TaxID=44012 RepID=UPI001C93AA56|nr:phage portal protein [Ferrimonas balearica]MBY6104900.1 phage portal protein [Ferrimonas balearica]
MKRNNIARMVVKDAQRMFDAASGGRLQASFDASGYTIDQVIYAELDTLRGRARNQGRNNDYVRRFRQLLRVNILGHAGFALRSLVTDWEGQPDRLARQAIEQRWKVWCKRHKLTAKLRTAINSMPTDGEALVYTEAHRDGLRVRLLDPALLDTAYNVNESGKNLIRFGIEYDAFDEPVAYHLNEDYSHHHPGVGQHGASAGVNRKRIPAGQIHHLFFAEWVGQRRGLPWIASSMARLFQAHQLEYAAVTAHRIGAAKMGFFKEENGEEYTGDGESGDMALNAEAGTFENIGSLDFVPFDPTYPAGEFTQVHDQHLRATAAGWGMDFHTLANKLSDVNYSSARVGLLETREFYKELQEWVVESVIEPLFAAWLELELLAGRITVPTRTGPKALKRELAYYLPANFVGRRWAWVDPQKEAAAKKTEVEMRSTSLSQVIRERGDDPEDVFAEIADEQARMKALGITPVQVLKPKEASKDGDQQTQD